MKMSDFSVSHLIEQTREKSANPGGGAIVTLVGNLAVNLLLMMDKKNYHDLNHLADKKRKNLLKISDNLKLIMQDDIDSVSEMLTAYRKNMSKEEIENSLIKCIQAPAKTIEMLLEALDQASFFLENGKNETLSDGEISNRLMKEAIYSSIINIEINQKFVFYEFDKEYIINKCDSLYIKNQKIIERRKK